MEWYLNTTLMGSSASGVRGIFVEHHRLREWLTKVDLLVDGKPYATSSSATVVFSWNTLKLAHGSHTLQAVDYDDAANSAHSTVVTVNK